MKIHLSHLAYCTNIHPAETWVETQRVLDSHVIGVRDRLREQGILGTDEPFAIGLRLSAVAARELLDGDRLAGFKDWLEETNTYVFTINGFPYGGFHGERVKEKVFQPDWTDPARVEYTKNLFRILAEIARPETGASVSTLPGSHKTFRADESIIRRNLLDFADWLDVLSAETGHDFHLGLEPEPLGMFENTSETLRFFKTLREESKDAERLLRRIGVNFDTCHFALEYEDSRASLEALAMAGVRISKVHLSSALTFDPREAGALDAIRAFDEPVYFHQVLLRDASGGITRFTDLPEYLAAASSLDQYQEARVHFHIPLDAEPEPPLHSTRSEARAALEWRREHPRACPHFEIETYTWGVLPGAMRRPVEEQIAAEYQWVLNWK